MSGKGFSVLDVVLLHCFATVERCKLMLILSHLCLTVFLPFFAFCFFRKSFLPAVSFHMFITVEKHEDCINSPPLFIQQFSCALDNVLCLAEPSSYILVTSLCI